MITYQDYLKVGENPQDIAQFVRKVINQHQSSDLFKTAQIADDYDRCRNTTIMQYQKVITTITGKMVPDKWSATHRSTSNFFNIFTTQLNQYLLGNGVRWNEDHDAQLGKDFDLKLQRLGKAALLGGVAFGLYDFDHLTVFSVLEFAPIYDEWDGRLAMGVRFWQVDKDKPLRAVLYEADGMTNFMWSKDRPDESWTSLDNQCYMQAKTPYAWVTIGDAKDREDGTEEILPGNPVDGLPIVPLYANAHHQSELVGMREKIDAYDFILNGFEDDLDNAQLYWIISGAGGMEDMDLQQFIDRLKTVKAAAPMDGQAVTPVQVEIPHAARESLLDRLNKQLYRDAMMMNPEDIASGATTATQIRAAYERQNVKADQYEYCVLDFLYGLMNILKIDDEPTFTRSTIVNVQEEVQTVIQAAQYLTEDYITQKVLTLLGDGDKAEDMIANRDADELSMININGATDETA